MNLNELQSSYLEANEHASPEIKEFRARCAAIITICEKHKCTHLAADMINQDVSVGSAQALADHYAQTEVEKAALTVNAGAWDAALERAGAELDDTDADALTAQSGAPAAATQPGAPAAPVLRVGRLIH